MQQYHLRNRPNREITDESAIHAILKNGKYVVISMCYENEPYIVTLSYGYDPARHALFFHCSTEGLKLDFIKKNPTVCATVIEDGGYVVNECAHNYKTVVFWGNLSIVTDLGEKKHGMDVLINHLEKDSRVIMDMLVKSDQNYAKMAVLRLDITQIHGKAGK